MKIAVIIPCYKVKNKILSVINSIDNDIAIIYIIDDACPEESGKFILKHNIDPRVRVIFNSHNLGVGGAVMEGYKAALEDGMEIMLKIDGDGQMDPALIKYFIQPIVLGLADYTKGNRFFNLEHILRMPKIRLLGNSVLSFMAKFSTGYWTIFDPTNGYTAIHHKALSYLPFNKISQRYFFETDMLFRLNTIGAVVMDVPMNAHYGDEQSNLKIRKIWIEFFYKHTRNFLKRIFYNYYLRNMSIASLELPAGLLLIIFGLLFGIKQWIHSIQTEIGSTAGTVMLSALPIILGLQLILSFLSFDISSNPIRPIQIYRDDV